MNRLFRRNQRDTKQNIALRLARLERENNEIAFTLMKHMAICEGLSRIVIDKGLVTKEEYQDILHESAKLFNLVPSEELAKERPEEDKELAEKAKVIADEIQEAVDAEKEAEDAGDPRPESEVPNPEFDTTGESDGKPTEPTAEGAETEAGDTSGAAEAEKAE